MREAGDVCYADVYRDGTGVVEFLRYEDMKYAARRLDDSKFRSHEVGVNFGFCYLLAWTLCLYRSPLNSRPANCKQNGRHMQDR